MWNKYVVIWVHVKLSHDWSDVLQQNFKESLLHVFTCLTKKGKALSLSKQIQGSPHSILCFKWEQIRNMAAVSQGSLATPMAVKMSPLGASICVTTPLR